jgi:voltage-gated potassium channel
MRFTLKPLFNLEYQTLSAFLVVIIGTIGYHIIEGWRWLDSLYFAVMTATTVGYGDFHPATDKGKIFTMLYAIASIGVISSFIV